ncbi:hypothetical protein AB0I15_65640, partial [Nonomuraea sp. NPDC050643]
MQARARPGTCTTESERGPLSPGTPPSIDNRNTARAYAIALRALAAELGAGAPLTALEGEAGADRLAEWFTSRWGGAAAATFNARLDALGSAGGWWRDQDWLTGDPLRRIRRRARTPDRTKALDRD